MTKLQKFSKDIDEALFSSTYVSDEEIAEYQEDLDAYYNEKDALELE